MKKIAALIAMFGILASGTAFAGPLTTGQTVTTGGGETIYGGASAAAAALATAPILGRLSKGVHVGVAFTNAAYALTTKHLTGTKMYGTSFDSTAIFSQDAAAIAAPSANNSTAFPNTSWTAM
jgi:hypothetical protein